MLFSVLVSTVSQNEPQRYSQECFSTSKTLSLKPNKPKALSLVTKGEPSESETEDAENQSSWAMQKNQAAVLD